MDTYRHAGAPYLVSFRYHFAGDPHCLFAGHANMTAQTAGNYVLVVTLDRRVAADMHGEPGTRRRPAQHAYRVGTRQFVCVVLGVQHLHILVSFAARVGTILMRPLRRARVGV
jgi:hypothetical protein